MIEYDKKLSVDDMTIYELCDTTTGVHYMLCMHLGHHGNTISVTPMYNADGSLKTNSNWR